MSVAIELIILEFIALALVCFALIRYFKSPMVSLDVAISVYVSWVFGFAGTLLLPYDLSLAFVEGHRNNALELAWSCIYWR